MNKNILYSILCGAVFLGALLPLQAEPDILEMTESQNLEAFKLYVKENQDELEDTDDEERTALFRTVERGELAKAEVLLKYGANVNAKDVRENTPLHRAAAAGNKEMSLLLLKHAPNFSLRNQKGESALNVAKSFGHDKIVALLVERGADPAESTAFWWDITVALYVLYLLISITLTVWVAHTLFKNGRIFLVDSFRGNDELADSVNRLLVVGFYLINIGYITFALKTGMEMENMRQFMEALSTKVGVVLIILGLMHFFNIFMFGRLRKKTRDSARRQAELNTPASAPPPNPAEASGNA